MIIVVIGKYFPSDMAQLGLLLEKVHRGEKGGACWSTRSPVEHRRSRANWRRGEGMCPAMSYGL